VGAGISVARQSCRNTMITSRTRMPASTPRGFVYKIMLDTTAAVVLNALASGDW
jgi:hypothetical protein